MWLSQMPEHFYAILCVEFPVPATVSVSDVAEAAAVLIARHESLRTSFVLGEQPRQRVAAAGVQLLEVCSLDQGQWGPPDRPAVAEALTRWLREAPDPGRPVRVALAVELSSVAAAMAVRRVAARTRASRSSVVLAAICAVLARRANYRELVLPLISSNRFERLLANYVGTLTQGAIVTVETPGRSFDELVGHTWTTVVEASLHAKYDAAKRDVIDDQIQHERGLHINYDPLFNNLVPESW